MKPARTTSQQCAFNAGQAVALGIALNAILNVHPQRDELRAVIDGAVQAMLDQAGQASLPEDFVLGMETARDRYLSEP